MEHAVHEPGIPLAIAPLGEEVSAMNALTPPEFEVRQATIADAVAFAEQRVALYRENHGEDAGAHAQRLAATTSSAWRASTERGTCLTWLACTRDGGVVGSCALLLVERLPSPVNPSALEGYLGHVYIAPAWRRRGAGSALVGAAMAEARRRGLPRIRLHSSDAGLALYTRLGFRVRTNEMEWRTDPAG